MSLSSQLSASYSLLRNKNVIFIYIFSELQVLGKRKCLPFYIILTFYLGPGYGAWQLRSRCSISDRGNIRVFIFWKASRPLVVPTLPTRPFRGKAWSKRPHSLTTKPNNIVAFAVKPPCTCIDGCRHFRGICSVHILGQIDSTVSSAARSLH